MREEVAESYQKTTCKELKKILGLREQPVSGNKADLVKRALETHPDFDPPDGSERPQLKFLLKEVRLHRHSGMGKGQVYTRSQLLNMWKDKKPQVTTLVHTVSPIGTAGGSVASTGASSKKALKASLGKVRKVSQTKKTHMEAKSKRLLAETAKREEETQRIKDRGDGFWCPTKGCNRMFVTQKGLEKHLRKKECQSGIQMFHKSSRPVSADRVTNRKDHIMHTVAMRSGTVSTAEEDDNSAPRLYDGVMRGLPGGAYTLHTIEQGFASTSRRQNSKLDKDQKEYLEWCFRLGEHDKNLKINPRKAAAQMHIHGTSAGQDYYSKSRFASCNPDYWKDKGAPTFRVSRCLDHWYIKNWFSSRKSKGAPDAMESIEYQGEVVWGLLIARCRQICQELHLPILHSDGERKTKKELKVSICQKLMTVTDPLSVGMTCKSCKDGKEVAGTIISQVEFTENSGRMIFTIRLENGEEINRFREQMHDIS